MTLVDRQAQQVLQKRDLTVEAVLAGEVSEKMESFLAEVQDGELQASIAKMEATLFAQYASFEEQLQQKGVKLEKVVERNKNYHMQQFTYLTEKLQEDLKLKHDVTLKQYRLAENLLLPNGKPQERMYNPLQYMNSYGPLLVDDLLELNFQFDGSHYVVYL